MDPGLVSEGFLIDLPDNFPSVIHVLLWYFPNTKVTQVGSFMTFLSFLCIIPLLDILRRYLKEKWFSLWFQTRISLLYRPKIPSVDHIFSMSSLVRLSPTAYLYT